MEIAFTKRIAYTFLITSFLFLLVFHIPSGEGEHVENQQLERDFYARYFLGNDEGTVHDIEFTIIEGTNGDLYIMTGDEFNRYQNNESFSTVLSSENTLSYKGSWTAPDGNNYYLIIDNLDNAHSADAKPEGDIYYDLGIEEENDETNVSYHFGLTETLTCCGIAFAVLFTIIIVLYVQRARVPSVGVRKRHIPPYQPEIIFQPPVLPMYQQSNKCPQCGRETRYMEERGDHFCWTCDIYMKDLLATRKKRMG